MIDISDESVKKALKSYKMMNLFYVVNMIVFGACRINGIMNNTVFLALELSTLIAIWLLAKEKARYIYHVESLTKDAEYSTNGQILFDINIGNVVLAFCKEEDTVRRGYIFKDKNGELVFRIEGASRDYRGSMDDFDANLQSIRNMGFMFFRNNTLYSVRKSIG